MIEGSEHGGSGSEPMWWGLFAAGGMVAALITPAHILVQSILGALGLPVATARYARARRLMDNPLVRLYLFTVVTLPLFHWAHRFRFYVMDVGITGARQAIAVLCYGSAIVSTLRAARTLLLWPRRKEG
jgi:fumarate reductase subunit D